MCKASLLQNIGVFSAFHAEKRSVVLLFSYAKEQGKKIKIMQTLKKEKKNNYLQSPYRHGAKNKSVSGN
jgi:hypothetical protein